MKKYLLGALLVIGATSFGAVAMPVAGSSGTPDTATLPVKVVGKVLDTATAKILVVTPMKNAGVNGGAIEFDFGDLIAGQNQQLEGTYKIEVIQNGSQVALSTSPTAILEGGNQIGNDNKRVTVDIGTGKQTTPDDVTLTYTLSNLAKQADKSYMGALTVDAEVKAGAEAGTFVDRTVGIKVGVTGV